MESGELRKRRTSVRRIVLAAAPGLVIVIISLFPELLSWRIGSVQVDAGFGMTQAAALLAGLLLMVTGVSFARYGYRSGIVLKLLLVLCSGAGAGVAVEVAYRLVLAVTHSPKDTVAFLALSEPIHQFDRTLGYAYLPGASARAVWVADGNVTGTWEHAVNILGNIGDPRISDNWQTRQHRIIVVGDSFTANSAYGGVAWPDFLYGELAQNHGMDLAVLNFARESYGVLQMLTMARATLDEYRPTLVVVAFIADDLNRGRIWRSTFLDGRYTRSVISTTPTPDPGPLLRHDSHLISEDVRQLSIGDAAPTLLDQFSRFSSEVSSSYVHALRSPGRSFLFNKIVYADPFANVGGRNPRRMLTDFRQDPESAEDLAALNADGVLVATVHIPTYREIAAGRYDLTRQEQQLLSSLRASLQNSVHVALLDYVVPPERGLPEAFMLPGDHHPSTAGARMYGKAVAAAILKDRLLSR